MDGNNIGVRALNLLTIDRDPVPWILMTTLGWFAGGILSRGVNISQWLI